MEITIQVDEPFETAIDPVKVEEALRVVFQLYPPHNSSTGSVSVVITHSDTVQQLNCQYRGIDAPTDVLSFDDTSDPDFLGAGISPHLGDIIIAYPVANAQAQAAGHNVSEEVLLLTVHGALHLLGYTHDTPADKHEMWLAQSRILTELGLSHIRPTEN